MPNGFVDMDASTPIISDMEKKQKGYEEMDVTDPLKESVTVEKLKEGLNKIKKDIVVFQSREKMTHKFLDSIEELNCWDAGSVAWHYATHLRSARSLLNSISIALDTSLVQLDKGISTDYAYENFENNARIPLNDFLTKNVESLEKKLTEAKTFYGMGCIESQLSRLNHFSCLYERFFWDILAKFTQLKEIKVAQESPFE